MHLRTVCCVAALAIGLTNDESTVAAPGGELRAALATLQTAGPGDGSQRQLGTAWATVSAADAANLTEILTAMQETSPLANNWLRSAVDAIVEREVAAGRQLPMEELTEFLYDPSGGPFARRLAYELILRFDSTAPDRLLPKMLDDRSLELRYDAVAHLIKQAETLGKDQALRKAELYQQALAASRDFQQVKDCATALEKLGKSVDLNDVLGFITDWKLVGPFDNSSKTGFDKVYPPEVSLNLSASYRGKQRTIHWSQNSANGAEGEVDLNKAIGKNMGAVAYAAVAFSVPEARDVQCRLTSKNANKIWVNGALAAENEVYHSGSKVDQYIAPAKLKAGNNFILLKICQNEQTESWAQDWAFQFRLTDDLGGAVPIAVRADVASTDL